MLLTVSGLRKPFAIVTLALFSLANKADGQFAAVESLLSRVSDVGIYGTYAGFKPKSEVLTTRRPGRSPKQDGLFGYGLELSFSISAVTKAKDSGPSAATASNGATKPADDPGQLTETIVTKVFDATKNPPLDVRIDTVRKYAPKTPKPAPVDTVGLIEFALGYGQLTGFRSQDASFDLRGVVREFPAVSIYYTDEHVPKLISSYYGIRSGLISLSGLQAFDADGTVYSGSAQSFQIGAVFGKVVGIGRVNLFLEADYTYRKFGSMEWKALNNKVPAYLPRALGMSSWGISTGIQTELRAPTAATGK